MQALSNQGIKKGGYSADLVKKILGDKPKLMLTSSYGENISKFEDGKPTQEIEATRYFFAVAGGQPISVKFPENYAPEVEQFDYVNLNDFEAIEITRTHRIYYRASSMKKV